MREERRKKRELINRTEGRGGRKIKDIIRKIRERKLYKEREMRKGRRDKGV